ncbi:stage II sporulation protein D [Clostridioides difficile]|nr:stage II sporulation protein D [Clostridioides difficile]
MPANFDEDALKAQAVAARTYYINKLNNHCKEASKSEGEICDTTHCQVYMDKDERMKKWSEKDGEYNFIYRRWSCKRIKDRRSNYKRN